MSGKYLLDTNIVIALFGEDISVQKHIARAREIFIVRLKFQKRSELKFVSRTIPQSGEYNTPQLAAEFVSKACFGVSYP